MADFRNPQIGCAGWQVPTTLTEDVGGADTHLQRYAHRLGVVEVNASFYREHRRQTWAKWHDEIPAGFRFAVKAPRWLTHDQGLKGVDGLGAFLEQIAGPGPKLGPIVLQLPPALALDPAGMRGFLKAVPERHGGPVVSAQAFHSGFIPPAVKREA